MESEESDNNRKSVFLQYLTPSDIYQYNTTADDDKIPTCEFDNEVRKSAIDMEEWEHKRKAIEEYNNTHSGKHLFLNESKGLEVPPNEHPLNSIFREIEKARIEMLLVMKLLEDVRAAGGVDPDFRQQLRYVRSEETESNREVTRRTQIANLEASLLLFDDASERMKAEMETYRDTVMFQRHFFNDLLVYSEMFNIITFHGTDMSFVRNQDNLLINCSYVNSKDIGCCLKVEQGRDGYVSIKPHDSSFYMYLSVTSTIIDEYRSYISTFEYHPKLTTDAEKMSVITAMSRKLTAQSKSPYVASNLNVIMKMRHSILCKDLFNTLYAGCVEMIGRRSQDKDEQMMIILHDDEIIFDMNHIVSYRIRLCVNATAIYDDDVFAALSFHSDSVREDSEGGLDIGGLSPNSANLSGSSNLIGQVLDALNKSVISSLLKLQVQRYRSNSHLKNIRIAQDTRMAKDELFKYAYNACNGIMFIYHKLFLKYFLHAVYDNVELTNSKICIKYKELRDKLEIEVIFKMLLIPNYIILNCDNNIYVNGKLYDGLFSAFSGILGLFMSQIRYLYLNYCLQQKQGINRDLGNDLAIINGSGSVTIVSFVYNIPTPIAFFHAFIIYCKQGNLINKEAGWISIVRTDRTKIPVSAPAEDATYPY